MNNVIESYLVSLGFAVDQPELAKFKTALKDASDAAEKHTTGIVGQFVKWQGAIVGAFSAVGLATIGMMDKVADADLGFKLTAQRMFLSVDAARSLTIATKALGHSLEEIAWNPELHARLAVLWGDQRTLTASGPADAEQTLQKIRDVRFEITRAQVALQYVARDVTVMLYKALGGDAFLVKLRGWVEWLIANAPKISDWIVKTLVPIMKDALHVLQDVWKVTEALGRAFVRLIGAFSGDKELQKGALTFDSIGKAIDKAADYMVRFVDAVTSAELVVIDLFNALVDLLHLDFKSLGKDIGAASGDLTGGGAGVLGVGILGTILGAKTLGGLLKILRGVAKAGLGGVGEGAGAEIAAGGAGAAGASLGWLPGFGIAAGLDWLTKHFDIEGKINALDQKYDPNLTAFLGFGRGGGDLSKLASAVAWAESGGHQIDPRTGRITTSKTGALGIMQLMPGTAKALGVDPYDASQNLAGGLKFLGSLLKRYGGNVEEALAAYNWGPGNLDKAMKRHGGFSLDYLPKETRDYVNRIEGHMGQITINSPVYVQHSNATPEQIRAAVRDGNTEALERSKRKDLVNSQGAFAT